MGHPLSSRLWYNIWCPPPPEDEIDDAESRLFGFDDDDDEIGDSNDTFAPNCFSAKTNRVTAASDINCESHQESVQKDLYLAFSSSSCLLKVKVLCSEKDSKIWLDIVSSLAWQVAFVKPDTKKGGSMDPSDYVKIKCIASGNPTDRYVSLDVSHMHACTVHNLILIDSLLIAAICKRDCLLQNEKEYLRTVVGKIESRKPNVLIVEKSVSSYAQELLAKDISLVLNQELGQCDMFKVEKVLESFASGHAEKRPTTKTLMFFEGCLKRLGCTVLLRGNCREELKKIKHAMQLAVFAAYHLSLETSFLADEGATIPRVLSLTAMGAQQAWTNTGHVSAKSADRDTTDTLRAAEEKCLHTAAIVQMFDGISASPPSLRLDGESLNCLGSDTREFMSIGKQWNGLPPDDFQAGDLDNQNRLSCSYLPGMGNMVAAFHYSPMVTRSVNLPPLELNFNCHGMQDWVKGETLMVFDEMESLHMEVYGFLNSIERSIITLYEPVKTGIRKQIVEMKDLLKIERNEYEGLLLPVIKGSVHSMKSTIDTLELNRVRRGLS
ncbi:hypothetical protein ZWY2020_038990 [Hordeum vulgare]|nr:hypothetical protein ZWY2020_038990 [Hordeum vulgare]